MRDTIKGCVLGALVAAGVSVLIAQTPTWTTPRDWATGNLLTANDFNSQFRDNLLWLRQDAQLTGTAALLDLGCGSLGAGEVLFSDCTWATIPDQTPADNSITQAKMANAAVGRPQLRTATTNQSGNNKFLMPGNGYAFWPVQTTPVAATDCVLSSQTITAMDSGLWRWILNTSNVGCDDSISSVIRYMTASDDPALWVVLDAAGIVTSVWEAEDQPDSTPLGADPGQTVVNVGLPSLAVIEALYTDTLTAPQRTTALSCTGDYVTGRGWLPALTTLADLATIETRYRPSGRQWAMRCAAEESGQSVSLFYTSELVVSDGAWTLP